MEMKGSVTGPHGKRQRPPGESGGAEVLGYVTGPFRILAMQPFQCLTDRSMQRTSLAGHQVAQHRFANQGMPKRQPVTILEHEGLYDRRSGAVDQWPFRAHEHF